ncbi:MAG: hypothetical protein EOM35_06585 [Negativicutes bacterium]|nr:hypothetical protein [Negativicutes bacterium]
MAEDKALKPKSFRIDDETAEKFKEISSNIGGNQQETLAKLIEAFEFQSGKAVLTEKKADIEQFEKYSNALTRMFMGSLEDNQNITETVRTEFDAQLKSKDVTIQDLQSQLTVAKQLKEESTMKAKAHAEENARLNSVIDSMSKEYEAKMGDMQSMLEDKDKLNKALTDSHNDLKHKVDDMQQEHEQFVVVSSELDKLKREHEQTTRDKTDLEKRLERESEEHEKAIADLRQHEADALERAKEQSQLQTDKKLLEVERKYQEQVQSIKEQMQAAVDKYQQKYFDLLEQSKVQSDDGAME